MESSTQENGWGDFIGPWGILNFHLPLREGGLAKWEVESFSDFFWRGQQGFFTGEMGGSPSPNGQNLIILHPSGKVLPQ